MVSPSLSLSSNANRLGVAVPVRRRTDSLRPLTGRAVSSDSLDRPTSLAVNLTGAATSTLARRRGVMDSGSSSARPGAGMPSRGDPGPMRWVFTGITRMEEVQKCSQARSYLAHSLQLAWRSLVSVGLPSQRSTTVGVWGGSPHYAARSVPRCGPNQNETRALRWARPRCLRTTHTALISHACRARVELSVQAPFRNASIKFPKATGNRVVMTFGGSPDRLNNVCSGLKSTSVNRPVD